MVPVPTAPAGCHSWLAGIAPYLEQTTMYNAMNFAYQTRLHRNGPIPAPIIGPNPTDYTVNKASIATLLCPSDGIVNTCCGLCTVHQLPARQFQLCGEHGHPRNVLLPGDPPNSGNLPPLTGIMSMSKMYLGQVFCSTAASDATTNITVTLASITDGTSNTAAVSESLLNDGSGNSPDKRRNCTTPARDSSMPRTIPASRPSRSSRMAWRTRSSTSPGVISRA